MNKQLWIADEGWPSHLGVGQGANNSYHKKPACSKCKVGNPEGKRQHGRSRHRWEDNIRINFRKQGMSV